MGDDHACALVGGALRCAGSNTLGQHGVPPGPPTQSFVLVERFDQAALVEVSAAYGATAVRDATGALWTFGASSRGQLGREPVDPSPAVLVLPGIVRRVSLRFAHGCAIVDGAIAGALHCWGSNAEGELGQGDPVGSADQPLPVRVAPALSFDDVACGQGHTCAITSSGLLSCWGRNTEGELGLGEGAPSQVRTPTMIEGRWRAVAAGQSHTCAISDARDLYCWGDDFDADEHAGPLGLPGAEVHLTPTLVDDGGDWAELSTDTFHTCALRVDGSLWCWGRNAEGQLGLGDPTARGDAPLRIGARSDWVHVAVGRFSTCGQTRDGRTHCAGDNRDGQLGLGDRERRDVLTTVSLGE